MKKKCISLYPFWVANQVFVHFHSRFYSAKVTRLAEFTKMQIYIAIFATPLTIVYVKWYDINYKWNRLINFLCEEWHANFSIKSFHTAYFFQWPIKRQKNQRAESNNELFSGFKRIWNIHVQSITLSKTGFLPFLVAYVLFNWVFNFAIIRA